MGKRICSDYLLIIMLSLVFCVGLVHEGLPRGHDVLYEITRIAEYSHSLKNDGFPVRWSANLEGGFGEPIFNFFPPLFLITSAIQILLGLSISGAIKGSIFIFTLAGGIGMYLFSSQFYGRNGGLFAAFFYIIAPYHLVDIYIRNAYSEYTASALAPFIFWGIAFICRERNFSSRSILILTSVGALFVVSHNLSLLMYTPLFVAFFLFNFTLNRNWKSLLTIFLAAVLVFLLTAFYVLPVLFEKEFVQTWQLTIGQFDVLKNFSTLRSLFGMSNWYSLTPFSFILLLLILIAMIFKRKEFKKSVYTNLCLFIGFLLILLFLTTSSSRFVWETFPSLRLFQFPWRLLSPATFVICFLTGSIIYLREFYLTLFSKKEKKNSMYVLPIMILVLFIVGTIFVLFSADQSKYVIVADSKFTPENIRKKNLRATVANEYRPIWIKEKSKLTFGKGLLASCPDVEINAIKIHSTLREYTVYLHEKCQMTANVHYFPGWKIYDNGFPVHFLITNQGVMDFTLPAGTHQLKLILENTPVRTAGNLLSLFGLIIYGSLLFMVSLKFIY